MIESIMYFGIGFLSAALSVLVVVPAVHGRAVRLTNRQLEREIPPSTAEILADKDLLRAEFAISTRRLELDIDQLKTKNASQLAELGKKGDAINRLNIELDAVRDQLRAAEEFAVKPTAVYETDCVLSDTESKLSNLVGDLNERSSLAEAQKLKIVALQTQVEANATALQDAERELDERSSLVDTQKIEIIALKTQVEAKAMAVHEAEHALSDKESKLANLVGELNERSSLAETQKLKIVALQTQVEANATALQEAERELDERSSLADAQKIEIIGLKTQVVEAKATALYETERGLSDQESKLAELMGELDERSSLADIQKHEIIALKAQVEASATAVHEAERALSDKESKLAELMGELEERSSLADAQKHEIIALQNQVEANAAALYEAEGAWYDKDSKLANLVCELGERSILADAQKHEIIALQNQVEALDQRLDWASNELKAEEDRRNAERIELQAAAQKLMEERGKFDNFHRRVAELVKQVVAQTTEDKILARRAKDDLENRLVQQSRLLTEREFELKHLRGEIEIARNAEADLRVAIIEIDDRAKAAIQNVEAEKAKLHAALDRANGERVRLAHELANMKRQAEEAWAA
jgi:chromosome segregation ATPase